ncbi:MAG: hypothetical protein QM485_11960 [Flavobacteriaceae bacterium]
MRRSKIFSFTIGFFHNNEFLNKSRISSRFFAAFDSSAHQINKGISGSSALSSLIIKPLIIGIASLPGSRYAEQAI